MQFDSRSLTSRFVRFSAAAVDEKGMQRIYLSSCLLLLFHKGPPSGGSSRRESSRDGFDIDTV